MNTVDKIIKLINEHHATAASITKEIGLNHSAIDNWKSGKAKPSADALAKLADYFDVSVDYLLGRTNQKNPFPGSKTAPSDYLEKNAFPYIPDDYIKIPILGDICAGNGIYADENIQGYEPVSKESVPGYPDIEYCWLRVEGNSMEPFLYQNDLVLVRHQPSVDSGSLAAVLIDGSEGMIKYVEYGRNWISLVSENKDYPERRFEGADIQRVYIMGLVVESKRRIK